MSSDVQTRVDIYLPVRRGIPPLRRYLSDTIERLPFTWAKARTDIAAKHLDTVFGQLWNVLNPLLLGSVYALLISFLSAGPLNVSRLAFVLGGLFAFYYTRGVVIGGANSVISSGSALMNSSFPRVTLPLASLISATLVYLPSLIVYGVFHLLAGFPVGVVTLWVFPIMVIQALLSFGLALLFSTATVFFRDIASFLPYILRIWMYLTPVLFRLDDLPFDWARDYAYVNPLAPVFDAWGSVLFDGIAPSAESLLWSLGWMVVLLVVGIWAFLSKEREFAFRI